MAKTIQGMGTIFVDGYELLKLIDAVVSEELPVDKNWAAGLRYAKRLIREQMGLKPKEQKDGDE